MVVTVAGGCAFATAPVQAQRATGVVTDEGSRTPIAGAVVSILDSLRRPVASVVSTSAGRYSVLMPANASQLRVVRIGFEPVVVEVPRQHEDPFVRDVAMHRLPTLLSGRRANENRLCPATPQSAGALSLWEQARSALLASVVTRESNPARVTVMTYQRVLQPRDSLVTRQIASRVTGNSTRPFLAADAAQLAERGYMDLATGTLRAPDADVLLDERFAATHCFSMRAADERHPGAVGLAFDPVRGRDSLVDVSGTLWMDAAVPALRSIEFFFTDSAAMFKRVGAGGTLLFRTMPNGVVFVEQWTMSLPVLDANGPIAASRKGQVVYLGPLRTTERSETGGIVLDAVWPDSTRWEAPLKPVAGLLSEAKSLKPFADALMVLEGTHDTLYTDAEGRFSFFPVLPGRYVLEAVDTSAQNYVPARISAKTVEVKAGLPLDLHFELPARMESIRALCGQFEMPPTSAILLGRMLDSVSGASIPASTTLLAEWLPDETSQHRENQTVGVDSYGRFSVCGVPRDRSILLSARRFGVPADQTDVTIRPQTTVAAITWPLDVSVLTHAVAPRLASIRGHITQAGKQSALKGADLWIPNLDRHVTSDSAGAFVFDSIPAGQYMLQVRNLGYGVTREVVTLAEGQDTVRNFALSTVAMLDAVNTTATRISRPLKEFDERRKAGAGGYFVSDSVLRMNEGGLLTSVLMSRISGAHLIPGKNGTTNLISTRRSLPCPATTPSCASPPCYVSLVIDGALSYTGTDSLVPPPDLGHFSTTELSGIEFYPATSIGPTQFNSTKSGCGTLFLWTRER